MNAYHKFQVAIRLSSLQNITIRQATCFQIRLTVYYKDAKGQNIIASPYECFNISTNPKIDQNMNAGEILHDGSYLSPKILMNGFNKTVPISSVCVFKGELPIQQKKNIHPEIYVYAELFWSLSKQPEMVGDWTGHTKANCFSSSMQMYFSSHFSSCSVESSIHCLLSELKLEQEDYFSQLAKQRLYYNMEQVQSTSLYDAVLDSLISSVQQLLKWNKKLREFEKITNQLPKPKDRSQWKYFRLKRLLEVSSPAKQKQKKKINFPETLLSLKSSEYLECTKTDAYRVSQYLFICWKDFLGLLQQFPNSKYFDYLKQQYLQCLEKHHWTNNFEVTDDADNKILQKCSKIPHLLKFVSSQKYQCQVKMSIKDQSILQQASANKLEKAQHVIILVHGFQASSFDMELIGAYIKYKNPRTYIMISQANQGRTETPIQQCAHRLAIQVKNYLNNRELKLAKISFIGHSLGGLIIRAALKYLQLYKNSFHLFITLCSPHIGYLYHTSKIVTTSMWVMNQVKKDRSMIELTMADNQNLKKTFLYELSQCTLISCFKNVILIGSKQDEYVPFGSAMLLQRQFLYETSSAKIHQAMYQNIMKSISEKTIRFELVYKDKIKDLSGFIGRTAHIKVLSYLPMIQLYIHLISNLL